MKTHELKCHPEPFLSLTVGNKTHEVRKDDRDFRVGDVLHMREWNPDTQKYTGCEAWFRVTYKTTGGSWGLPDGLCVLSVRETRVR